MRRDTEFGILLEIMGKEKERLTQRQRENFERYLDISEYVR
jgi:hypothetical protein